MSYRILSLYFGHDANLCLLEDGEPVLVLEKERASRIKHDQGHMLQIVARVLKEHGWGLDSIDMVVINPHCRPDAKGELLKWEIKGRPYTQNKDYLAPDWKGAPEGRASAHKLRIFNKVFDCLAVDHHLAHAAGAFFTSPFERAGILSADGGGDERFVALAYGEGNKIKWIEYDWGRQKHSDRSELNIGSAWASVGEHNFGFKRLEGAGKLMGLASYAQADQQMIDTMLRHMLFYWAFPFPCYLFKKPFRMEAKDGFAQKMAATLQEVTTQLFLAASRRMKMLEDTENLCLVGGCAMNCIANTAVHTSGLFGHTYVPAQPHDGGLALGQALYAWHHVLNNPRQPRAWSPYLGTDIGPAPLDAAEDIVSALVQGKTVGLAHGRAESGPRALGHRTILADPRRAEVREHLNQNVKHREWFRPFAPVVLAEDYADWFVEKVPSCYMSYTAQVRPEKAEVIPGVVHVDGTARPQLLSKDGDPMLRAVLTLFKEKTGVPVLLNTSFNNQEPLVDTLEQAERTWRRTGLDVLVTPQGVQEKDRPASTLKMDFGPGQAESQGPLAQAEIAAS